MASEKERAYFRERNKTPEQRAHRAKWADNNKDKRADHAADYRKRNPKKVEHRNKIRGMPKGKCASCGAPGAEKDHVSWNPPKVQWLCKPCHQKKHGKKMSKALDFQGLSIHVETPKGTQRHWKDPHTGESGSTTMLYHYGYIEGTKGADGEEYDCYVGPDEAADLAFIIHQNEKGTTTYDEDKVMLGFSNIHDAISGYLAHYDDPSFLGSISTVPMGEFKQKIPTDGDGMYKADPKKTPAEPHERQTGSKKNKPGSAKDSSSGIKLSAETIATLSAKAKKHGIPLGTLKAVYRRGAGAFSTSHHPKANRHSWAMGRVNSFIKRGHPQDNDLKRSSTFGGANPGRVQEEETEKAVDMDISEEGMSGPQKVEGADKAVSVDISEEAMSGPQKVVGADNPAGKKDLDKATAHKNPKGGLTAAGRAHFKRKEGANLKPGVKGAADTPEKMRRKGSFLTRFYGKSPQPPFVKPNGEPTRHALAAAAWGEPVPKSAEAAARLNAKGKALLARYENSKKNAKKSIGGEQMEKAIMKAAAVMGGGGMSAEAQLEFLEKFRGTQLYQEAKEALRAYNKKAEKIDKEHAKLNKLDDKARALREKAYKIQDEADKKARELHAKATEISKPYYAGYDKRHEADEEWTAKKKELVAKLIAID